MPVCLTVFPVLKFIPAIKIIGGAVSKILNGFYAVFSKGNEHWRCYAWNILESFFDPKLFPISIDISVNFFRQVLKLTVNWIICWI